MPTSIITIEPEPYSTFISKWLGWMLLLVLFVIAMVYISNFTVESVQCANTIEGIGAERSLRMHELSASGGRP
jgi:hypothetical protein